MSFKVEIKSRLKVLRLVPEVRREFAKEIQEPLRKEIIDNLEKGRSPVKGKRFVPYSPQYALRKKGGKRRPVTLKDTGDLHKSLDITVIRDKIRVRFEDFKAKYHNNEGAGRSKVIRRMLPDQKGETFRPSILRIVQKVLEQSVKSVVNRLDRRG